MRVLSTVSLTSNQKRVLAKIIASPTPKVAGEEISGDQNLIAARDQLAELGAIEHVGGEASLTDKGEQLAREDNITDEGGQLTPDGEKLAHTSTTGEPDDDSAEAPAQTPPPAGMGGPAPVAGGTPGGDNLFMSDTPPSFKDFLENEEKVRKQFDKPVRGLNRKPSTPASRQKARAKRWSKTGVSDATIKWMRDEGML
jgi:hypothetical protein